MNLGFYIVIPITFQPFYDFEMDYITETRCKGILLEFDPNSQ